MLLNNAQKFEKDDIIAIKIANGDELVARVVEDTGGYLLVDRPLTLVPSQQGIAMMQSMFAMDTSKPVAINKSNILMTCTVREDVDAGYRETTSGIQQIRKPGIIV